MSKNYKLETAQARLAEAKNDVRKARAALAKAESGGAVKDLADELAVALDLVSLCEGEVRAAKRTDADVAKSKATNYGAIPHGPVSRAHAATADTAAWLETHRPDVRAAQLAERERAVSRAREEHNAAVARAQADLAREKANNPNAPMFWYILKNSNGQTRRILATSPADAIDTANRTSNFGSVGIISARRERK